MPIYAYRCEACGFAKDALQKISDAPLTECPSCGKPTLKKQVTAAGFQLKGTGWYVTDFRSNGNAPATGTAAVSPTASPVAGGPGTTAPAPAAGESASAPAPAPAPAPTPSSGNTPSPT